MKNRATMWAYPDVCMYHDAKDEKIIAEVGLPGIDRKEITLEAGDEGFCLKARHGGAFYDSCFRFDSRVDARRMHADLENGLLRVSAPIDRRELHARRIPIS